MRTSALFILAALVFSILAGTIEASWARRERRQFKEKSTVLHPLARSRFRSVRYPFPARAVHHVALFFGFLLATYVAILVLKTVHSFVAHWF
jgi:hypothetical protein